MSVPATSPANATAAAAGLARREFAAAALTTPSVRQPSHLAFGDWRALHAYHIGCFMRCLKERLLSNAAKLEDTSPYYFHSGRYAWDWRGMRSALERHMYATSSNRHRKFALLK